MQDYKLIFHPMVREDLRDIVDLISTYSGAATAERRLSEIESAVRSLSQTPHKGSLRDHIMPGLRAIPAGRKAVICFQVDDEVGEVRILAIAYAGREWALQLGRRVP